MALLVIMCAVLGIIFGVIAKGTLGKYGINIPLIDTEESRRIVGFMCTGLSAASFYLAYLAYKIGRKQAND